ncbi:cobalamin biosynthesis protein CobQ [Burkholderia sp. WAC0059]|uniref:ParA family protein n=1 Tax=Burkholderia sp. WAC0059 TaxID=2066022 RepID=UPI000C7EB9DD|nr:ParA family protein [Burkholderia sp. WAC0059]PLZ01776.1 cobalamin biosynthesis protein CobQ [Burkholderia sp. WAC0059]
MKSLLIVSAKGGTGRTMLTCQFAHYLRRVSRKRVLVLDLAEPACSAHLLGRGGQAEVAGDGHAMGRRRPDATERTGRIHVLCAGEVPGLASCDDPVRARYYANLRHLLAIASPWFDVCLIDCPALPDLRAVCAAALVDAMLSPVVLSPECIDSVAELINGTYGIRNIRARLNPQLRFIGLLPVMVQPTPLQQAQGRRLQARLSGWLIPDPRDRHGYLHLPQREAIARAQGLGVSVRQLVRGNPGASEGWRVLRACFDVLARQLDWTEGDAVLRMATPGAEVCDV